MLHNLRQSDWKARVRALFEDIQLRSVLIALLGSLILAFGLYHIHAQSIVTEGGVFGLMLLLEYWFHVSPAITSFIMNALCYALGWKLLGRKFLVYSTISFTSFSAFYAFFEQFPPLFPQIAEMPLTASIVGAIFIGVGAGLCVRIGGAPSGDDALAMSLSKLSGAPIQRVYLLSDLSVLLLSLSYIPLNRMLYSLLTVVLSGQIIGWVTKPDLFRKWNGQNHKKAAPQAE